MVCTPLLAQWAVWKGYCLIPCALESQHLFSKPPHIAFISDAINWSDDFDVFVTVAIAECAIHRQGVTFLQDIVSSIHTFLFQCCVILVLWLGLRPCSVSDQVTTRLDAELHNVLILVVHPFINYHIARLPNKLNVYNIFIYYLKFV